MKTNPIFLLSISLVLLPIKSQAKEKVADKIITTIIEDCKNFYSSHNLIKLAIGIGINRIIAHSLMDREIQDWYIKSIKNNCTDDVSKSVKHFGNGRIMVPIYLTAALIGELSKNSQIGSAIGEWGQRCSRALIVGVPPVLVLQVALGASRPEEEKGSHWHPFKDNNGVSGHSFIGAIPFLTTAKMTNSSLLQYSLYLGSTFTGISRINDNKHYFSQVILGWWIAYLAVNNLDRKSPQKVMITPEFLNCSAGVRITFHL